MLDELVSVIDSLKRRITEHRSYLDEGAPEARTRVSLVDPLLQALGWDVADPSLVEVEPRMAQGRADYALLGQAREPVLLLEAKKLGDANVPYDQIASYVVGQNMRRSVKIPYCGVTNGNRWLVFDVFTQSLVLDVSVERDDPRRCAVKLLSLWKSTLGDLAWLNSPRSCGELVRRPMKARATTRRLRTRPKYTRKSVGHRWTATQSGQADTFGLHK